MRSEYGDGYEIDEDYGRLEFARMQTWLTATYWSPGIGIGEILKGARNSAINVGCYHAGTQVGYLRVASDKTRFGYFMDVYVEESHRLRGIAGAMVRFVMEHPEFSEVYLWLLATRDSQPVYAKVGFGPLPVPENWMMIRKEKTRTEGESPG